MRQQFKVKQEPFKDYTTVYEAMYKPFKVETQSKPTRKAQANTNREGDSVKANAGANGFLSSTTYGVLSIILTFNGDVRQVTLIGELVRGQ